MTRVQTRRSSSHKSVIGISEFQESDIDLFRACFSSLEWCRSYGIEIAGMKVEEIVSRRIRPYPFVKRFVFRERQEAVGFAIVDFKDSQSSSCIVAGGVKPQKIDSGLGVHVAVLLCCFLFQNFHMSEIIAFPQNQSSERMLTRIGFRPDKEGLKEKTKLCLSGSEFPNSFSSRILGRLRREAI